MRGSFALLRMTSKGNGNNKSKSNGNGNINGRCRFLHSTSLRSK